MLCGLVGIDNGLDERIAGKAVAAVQSGAGAFAHGIEPAYAAAGIKVYKDAAAHIVGAGGNGDVLACDVNAQTQTLGVDVGEVALGGLGVFVGDVQADVVQAVNLHFVVYGARHNIARSQGEAFVILLHELFAVGQTQYAAVSAHGLGDEIGGMRLLRIVEHGGMELYELHVLHLALCTVDHGYAVSGGNVGV